MFTADELLDLITIVRNRITDLQDALERETDGRLAYEHMLATAESILLKLETHKLARA